MKSIRSYKKDGEPSKTTHRNGLTEQVSANKDAAALLNQLFHLIFKIHHTHNLFEDFEEEEAMLKSMEAADGWAARTGAWRHRKLRKPQI